jgi:hypothetical protein
MRAFIADSFRELFGNFKYILGFYGAASVVLASLASILDVAGVSYPSILSLVLIMVLPLHFLFYALTASIFNSHGGGVASGTLLVGKKPTRSHLDPTLVVSEPSNWPLNASSRYQRVFIVNRSHRDLSHIRLQEMVRRDLVTGNAIAVISLAQDTIENVKKTFHDLPNQSSKSNLMTFSLSDTEWPVSFNPLHLDPGEDIDLRVRENLSIFERHFQGADVKVHEILAQVFRALVGRPDVTLLDIERLLGRADASYRSELIRHLEVAGLHYCAAYWRDVYPALTPEVYAPIVNRLSAFLQYPTVRSLVCRPTRAMPIASALSLRKLMLFDLSGTAIREEHLQLLGRLILGRFRFSSTRKAQKVSLYIDSFWERSLVTLYGDGTLNSHDLTLGEDPPPSHTMNAND